MNSSNDQQYPYGQDPRHGYGPGPHPSNGGQPQPHGHQSYDDQPYGDQSYGDQSYGAQSYGAHVDGAQSHGAQVHGAQPYNAQAYDDQPYGDQSYGDQSYGDQSYGAQSYGAHVDGAQSHGAQVHGAQPYNAQAYDDQPYGDQSYGGEARGAQPYGQQPAYPSYGTAQQAPQADPGQGRPAGYGRQPATAVAHGQDPAIAQTWEGQTWDTQYQPGLQSAQSAQPAGQPGPAADETACPPPHLPPQGASGSYPLPPEAPAAPPDAEPTAPASAHRAAGYGAPTTLGNSRVTDAQRARAEGRSPIIPPGVQPAAITAGLGLLLALGAAIGQYALVVPLVLLQALTAAGWFRLNGMWPARQGIALAFAGGLVADIALLAAGRENGPAAILGTLGVWVLLTVVLQLRSHAGADERMEGLMATVASAALSVLAAGHLAAVPGAVTVGAVAVAVAVLVRALPLPGPASVVVALLAAAGGGAVAGALTDLGAKGALLGVAAGVCALIGLRVASYDYPSRFVHMTAGVALPLTAAAPAVYLLGRVLS